MTHEPLSADEQLKLSIFIVICALVSWALLYIGGFIPAILLVYGFIMMRKNKDFEHVEVTSKYAKLYFKILIYAVSVILALLVGVYILGWFSWGTEIYESALRGPMYEYFGVDLDDVDYSSSFPLRIALFVVLVPVFYILPLVGCIAAIHHFYLLPLRRHREWVVLNGVYSNEPKSAGG
jgi:hypothetical protein